MKRVRKLLCLALVLMMALSLSPTALGDGEHVHSWRQLSRTEPTCTKEGSVIYVCSCGETKTETLPALGHDWDSGRIWQDDSYPGGKKLHFTCRRCGYTWDEALPQEEPDDYGWEPPEEPEEPAIPDGAVSPISGGPSEDYSISAVPEDTSDRELGYCDETPVSITVTNTGNEPVRIRVSMHKGHGADFSTKDYYDLAFVSWDAAYTESLSWNYGTWEAVQQPGESSTLVVKVCMMLEDLDHDAVERKVWFHCSPVGEENSELAWNQAANISVPPMGPEVLLWVVLKYLPDPALSVGETATFALQLFTSGGRYVIHKEIDMYEWDKASGSFLHRGPVSWTTCSEGLVLEGYSEVPITEEHLENADEEGVFRFAFKGRGETKDGIPVESELFPVEAYLYKVDLILEAEDTSAGQIPEEGMVKVPLTIECQGTETMCYKGFDTWAGFSGYLNDELDYDSDALSWISPGSKEEMELSIQVTDKDVEAGEVRRTVQMKFSRLSDQGKRVTAATPADAASPWEIIYSNELEIVVPLLAPPADPAPAPEPRPFCEPAMTGLGEGMAEWTLTRCDEHAALAREAKGKTPEEALGLWTKALEAEYDEWLSEAEEALHPAIQAERDAFMEQLEACRTAWADLVGEDYAAEKAAELTMHKVSLLCFSRRADEAAWAAVLNEAEDLDAAESPAACQRQNRDGAMELQTRETTCETHRGLGLRAADAEGWRQLKRDWLLTLNGETDEWYLSADEESRPLIAEARQSFGRWLAAEEALLKLQHPENEALVQQLLALAVRERAMDGCGVGSAGNPAIHPGT